MPLHTAAIGLIWENLRQIHMGYRPQSVVIGELTVDQLAVMNIARTQCHYPPMEREVIFLGKHIYSSRFLRDSYTICDIVDQISSAMSPMAIMLDSLKMSSMQNPNPRADRHGNVEIRDVAVFECSARYPRPELYSIVPKGDTLKPKKENAPHCNRCGAFR